jgi:CheY-like chemotaxis protein
VVAIEQALSILGRRPSDLALVDNGLPGLDGYEVARRARSILGHRIYLVALTGYGQTEDKAGARSRL